MSESGQQPSPPLWGVSAEFESAADLVAALRALRDRGLGRLDVFSPVPVPEVDAVLSLPYGHIGLFSIAAAIAGGLLMMGMCLYATIVSYRFNIGGRPLVSWPSYVVPTVSFAMLCGAVAAVAAFLLLNRLPRLNHPAFNIPDFREVTEDRFFLVVEARDEEFNPAAVEYVMRALAAPPSRTSRVPR